MKIVIETIDHKQQRYPTVGDYWIDADGTIQVRVSKFGTEQEQFAVALHELVELMLCRYRGVDFKEIDQFDIKYEKQREVREFNTGKEDHSEPGDSPFAPYRHEHRFAENIERQFIHETGINWADYNKKVEKL